HRVAGARPADVRGAARAGRLSRGGLRRDGRRLPGLRQRGVRPAAVCRRPARARGPDRVKTAGRVLLMAIVLVAAAAPWLAPNSPDRQFDTYLYAPPTPLHATSFSPLHLVNRRERRFEVGETRAPLRWFGAGHLISSADPNEPLLLLGADAYGRDIFARLLYGARASLGI